MSDNRKERPKANNPDGATTEEVLFACQKGSGKQLMLRIARYRGHRYCDARLWLTTPEGLKPTTKGVSMPLQQLRDIGAALIAWNDDTAPDEPVEAA